MIAALVSTLPGLLGSCTMIPGPGASAEARASLERSERTAVVSADDVSADGDGAVDERRVSALLGVRPEGTAEEPVLLYLHGTPGDAAG